MTETTQDKDVANSISAEEAMQLMEEMGFGSSPLQFLDECAAAHFKRIEWLATNEKKTDALLSKLDSLGWVPALDRRAYVDICKFGFRGGNDVLAAIAAELAVEHQPITLRGLFYQVVSAGALPSTDQKHYNRLGRILSTLRREGLIPYQWIVDNLRQTIKPSSWSGLADFADTVRDAYRKDFWARLPSYVHVFCEKDAVSGTLAPVTQEYDVPLSPVRGYCSDSFAYEVGSQWREIDKPIHAYYLGDYDPSGFDIERDLEKKLREHAPEAEIHWQRIAVNEPDFDAFNLIELKVKKTDMRYRKFVDEHGNRCAEVDALPPRELRRRVETAILSHIPTEEWEKLKAIEEQEKETFNELLGSLQ